ncbi:uncharacterized protein LOC144560881 [Carex rostrata]
MGSIPNSKVEAVNELIREKQSALVQLREQLLKAQERMKRFADKSRTERHFSIGDWVYLKLQPYRQTTVGGKKNHKLRCKYSGPFEVIEKIGKLAYKLKLPTGSQVHPVFHVSQLKGRIGNGQPVLPNLPIMGADGKWRVEPVAILQRRIVKKGNTAAAEILVQWSNLPESEATWEDYETLIQQFPDSTLEDKVDLEEEGVSNTARLTQCRREG